MSIYCKVCKYEMTTAGFMGNLTAEVFEILKARFTRFAFWDDFMNDFANHQKLCCPQCENYVAWLTEPEVKKRKKRQKIAKAYNNEKQAS